MNHFEILRTEGFARRGRLKLAHGEVDTPAFMPVGTYGVVKTVSPAELVQVGAQIILGNTYHLYLRPGLETLRRAGGLHRFMSWSRPILTDSGGFQVFSLSPMKKVSDDGIVFRSPLNGDRIFLTPELSAEIQQVIGSDIAMVLDELVALPNEPAVIEAAVQRSLSWAKRFLEFRRRDEGPEGNGQKIFGIIQGGTDLALRKRSCDETCALPVDGVAVGGLSVGEPFEQMVAVLQGLAPHLPSPLPHYLMGVGTPLDLLEGVFNGIDMFDCVLPTRNARNGGFFTRQGLLNIRNAKYSADDGPIEQGCECECCRHFSRAYLRHLFQIKEILGCRLATLHNLHYYQRFMFEVRSHLDGGMFLPFYRRTRAELMAAYGKSGTVETGEVK